MQKLLPQVGGELLNLGHAPAGFLAIAAALPGEYSKLLQPEWAE